MKTKISILALLFSLLMNAQQGVNYKAVISENGAVIQNQIVAVYFTILEDGTTNVFEENHTVATDTNGIIILNIGEGIVTGGDFSLVDWSQEQFLKVEVNTGSGITDMGTTMFKSVPVALFSKKSEETVFTTTNNVTSNIRGDIINDDFVFGDTQLDGAGTKMFFDKSKGAFRVGNTVSTIWDDVNVGLYSFALGRDVKASGESSVAIGTGNYVEGDYATAIGTQSFVDGDFSMVFGNSSNAIGNESIAIGSANITRGVVSMAIGFDNEADGDFSVAIGQSTEANGERSITLGHETYANGYSSLATGYVSLANGDVSSTLGFSNTAESYAQTSLGMNSTIVTGTVDSYVATDRLFVVGNGINGSNRSDAVVVLKNGNTTINGDLEVQEVNALDSGDADMKAYIYGLVGSDGGTSVSSSDGFSESKESTGYYKITFDVPMSRTSYIGVATLHDTIGFIKLTRQHDFLEVRTYNTAGVLSDSDFYFVVYKK
ncbi:MAG: hypothetical protein PSN34_04370 [Urechidicola sp.]|nr:hypothetical protein [Urechidicola sp.]